MSLKLALYFALRRIVPMEPLRKSVRMYLRLSNKIRYGDYYFPRDVSIEIGTSCNRACIYCPQSVDKAPRNLMSEETFTAILYRLKEINWQGPIGYTHFNEPLLDKRIIWFVERTKCILPKSLPQMITNGDALTEDLTKRLIAAGVANICITRHDDDFEDWNARIVPLAKKYEPYFSLGDLHGKAISNRGGLVTDPRVIIEKLKRCDNPEGSLHITIDGRAMLCCCDYYHEHTFGDVIKEGILPIWHKPEFKRVRDEVRAGKPRLDICKACFGQKKK